MKEPHKRPDFSKLVVTSLWPWRQWQDTWRLLSMLTKVNIKLLL